MYYYYYLLNYDLKIFKIAMNVNMTLFFLEGGGIRSGHLSDARLSLEAV